MKEQIVRFLLFVFCAVPVGLSAQKSIPVETISGSVYEVDETGQKMPLVGVNLYWLGTRSGTVSNEQGAFQLAWNPGSDLLVFSYVGFQTDTVQVRRGSPVTVEMKSTLELDEIAIVSRQKTSSISMIDARKTELISEKELLKAACCNLSESFETNPSIDVAFTDAVTGTRQIQMLGLAGPYVQLTRENMPGLRGLSSVYGLTFIPGTWVEGLQLNKGTGSVLNGFESIAGQINLELRKPEEADPLYLNLFANNESRLEANLNLAHRFKNKNWSTALLLHASDQSQKMDDNGDSFVDMPVGNTYVILNRWKYRNESGLEGQFGVKYTSRENQGGQMDFDPNQRDNGFWGMDLDIRQTELWAKLGTVFAAKPWKSVALQTSASSYVQESYFGMNDYSARQESFYLNSIYQSRMGSDVHRFKTGISVQLDRYEELLNSVDLGFTEIVPGAYFEYTLEPSAKLAMVAGIRLDHHNHFGWFATPRLHLRYAPAAKSVFRLSGGRGARTANIIMENSGILATSREIVFQSSNPDLPYGFQQEAAWNFGLNFTQKFELDYREGSVSFDYYRTDFEQQVVLDWDLSPQQAVFAELDGKSYANSFQAQLDYELIRRLDLRIAYRLYDVKTSYHGVLLEKPLQAKQRAFVNLAYESRKHWRFDLTLNRQGQKRIPDTGSNSEAYRLRDYSPAFSMVNAQVSKSWRENFELYLGVENLFNYTQENPILGSDQPFGPYFDSSLIWGPIRGQTIYAGLRYKLF